jgi:hypothetical protein
MYGFSLIFSLYTNCKLLEINSMDYAFLSAKHQLLIICQLSHFLKPLVCPGSGVWNY